MSTSQRTTKNEHRHLILRVYRSDQLSEEYYVANGLSIGRSDANQIQIEEPGIGRAHAKVERNGVGQFLLRSVTPELAIIKNGQRLSEIILSLGQQFEIGSAQFECFSNKQEPTNQVKFTLCPLCRKPIHSQADALPQACGNCLESIVVIPFTQGSSELIALPAHYGKYQVDRFVARGGMGFVFQGFNTDEPSEKVAIKVLKAAKTGVTTNDMQRFRSEIGLMRQINNPHVMTLLSYGSSHRQNYLIIPWIGGPNLREKIAFWKTRKKPLQFPEAIPMFLAICEGILAIHDQGIIHRDLKPANILFDSHENPIVADLGIAQSDRSVLAETQTGVILGTSEYMSPEQRWHPELVDLRSDLYALGVIFYEILTHSHPTGAWQPASQLNPTVPQEFDFLITLLLAATLEKRISKIDLVIVWLKKFKDAEQEPGDQEDRKNDFETNIARGIQTNHNIEAIQQQQNHVQHLPAVIFEHEESNSVPTKPSATAPESKQEPSKNKFTEFVGAVIFMIFIGMANRCDEKSKNNNNKKPPANVSVTPRAITAYRPDSLAIYESSDRSFQALLVATPDVTQVKDGSFSAVSHSAVFRDNEFFQVLEFSSTSSSLQDLKRAIPNVMRLHNANIVSESQGAYGGQKNVHCHSISAKSNTNSDFMLKCKILLWNGRVFAMIAKGKGAFVYQTKVAEFLDSFQLAN